MLYVEPLYVQASGGQSFPVLREFLVYSDGNAAYQPTLSAALNEVFGVTGGATKPPPTSGTGSNTGPPTNPQVSADLQQAIADAQRDENAAEAALRRGDFAAYGRYQKAVKSDLARISQDAGKSG